MLKLSTRLLKEEAERRGYKVDIIDKAANILRYTRPNGASYYLHSLHSAFTPVIASRIVNNKPVLHRIASEIGIPVPETVEMTSYRDGLELLAVYGKIVVKPANSAHGYGVTTNVVSPESLKKAYRLARRFSGRVLAQRFVSGEDYRLLYIDGKMAAASIRKPAYVVGDGEHTVKELIRIENRSDDRGPDYTRPKNYIDMDAAKRYLGDVIRQVPQVGEEVTVVGTANIGTGGESVDITDRVGPAMREAGERILRHLGMTIGGVDFMGSDDDFVLLEVNGNPSLGLHEMPAVGKPRPVAKLFLDWLERAVSSEQPSEDLSAHVAWPSRSTQ